MDKEMYQFLKEGMKRYKEATKIMVLFGKNIENELQNILKNHKNWGNFKVDKVRKIRSTKFWSEYPLFNADIFGQLYGDNVTIRIAINWYDSETDYPYYSIRILNNVSEKIYNKFKEYIVSTDNFEKSDNEVKLIFYPDPEDFDLERDFNRLIDEFVRGI